MKVYIAARFKGAENKPEIESLCAAVRASGLKDFCFIRDVENYEKTFFDNQQGLWVRALQEMNACDAFLIDISDQPSGGRVIEAGIAYALKQPIFVLVKSGVQYKEIYDGIAALVITYDDYSDIIEPLKNYLEPDKIPSVRLLQKL